MVVLVVGAESGRVEDVKDSSSRRRILERFWREVASRHRVVSTPSVNTGGTGTVRLRHAGSGRAGGMAEGGDVVTGRTSMKITLTLRAASL